MKNFRQLAQVQLLAKADGVELPQPPEIMSTEMEMSASPRVDNKVSESYKRDLKTAARNWI